MNKNKMTTAFIIRMHFAKDDPRWSWRFHYFASMVLPKMLSQSDQNFDICIRANKWHARSLKALSPKIKVYDIVDEKRGHIKAGYGAKAKVFFVDFVDFKDTVGLKRYDIQIGIDSDDMILRDDFLYRVKAECADSGKKSRHIGFQPYVFQASTLRCFTSFQYSKEAGSPIFALYQPNRERRYIHAYEDSHLKLPLYMESHVRVEEGYCAYSVHNCNSSTRLTAHNRQIII